MQTAFESVKRQRCGYGGGQSFAITVWDNRIMRTVKYNHRTLYLPNPWMRAKWVLEQKARYPRKQPARDRFNAVQRAFEDEQPRTMMGREPRGKAGSE